MLLPDGAHDEQVAQQREQAHQQAQQEEGGQELLREVEKPMRMNSDTVL